jgi:hypothetical protein
MQQANRDQTDSIQATHSILNVVWPDFLRRQKLPVGQLRTVSDLLRQLKKGCATFRFLDLPPELREMIYGMSLEELDCCERKTFRWTLPFDKPNRVMAVNYVDDSPTRTNSPFLLQVSHHVRSEAGKLYFGRKHFELFLDTWYVNCTENEVKMWLDNVVGNFATHLRQVTVHFKNQGGRDFDDETKITVQFSQRHGLQVTGSTTLWDENNFMYEGPRCSFVDMPAYVATLEENRSARNEKGEVVVDFFDDWDALRRACFGPCRKFVTKEEADDFHVLQLAGLEQEDPKDYLSSSW